MLAEPVASVRERAERLAGLVGGEVEETVARVGGGALPLAELPSFACAVEEELFDATPRRRAARRRDRARRPAAARRPGARGRRDRRGRDAPSPQRAPQGCRRLPRGADGRHRRAHRPRQDVARARADRQGHRPAARGAAARDLDRPRLRAARAAGRAAALARSTSRATSASCARWSPAPPGSTCSCS